jgi:uncharacterized protein (UPF0548 family)
MRRGNSAGTPVTYASVGMTQQPDIIAFPPPGFWARSEQWRIGSGVERFETASTLLLTWGLQRAARLDVEVIEDGDPTAYAGLEASGGRFHRREATEHSVSFGPDGTAFLVPGTVVRLGGLWTPHEKKHDFKVIYVISESRRVGFGLGTLDEKPVAGEEFFGLEWREDDSVWAIVRTVTSIPDLRWRWVLRPLIRLRQLIQLHANVRALSPARQV